jgi:hypothetical protein
MTYISGHDRSQLLLVLEAVDEYVGADNPVRFIDAFVDGLDLAAAGFGRVAPKVTGRFPKSFVSLCCSVANWTCLLDGRPLSRRIGSAMRTAFGFQGLSPGCLAGSEGSRAFGPQLRATLSCALGNRHHRLSS